MTASQNGYSKALDIAEITAISIRDPATIRLRLLDANKNEWDVNLPLNVLDLSLKSLPAERALVLNVETTEDHARQTCPIRSWKVSREARSPELTFSCRADNGSGLEIGFSIDPVTAIPNLAVTVAAG